MPTAALLALDIDLRAQPEGAAAADIGAKDRLAVVDQDPAGREVWALDRLHQLAVVDPLALDQPDRGLDQLADIVRRDRGRHPDRDPARAIGQQVREQAGENLGLFLLAIVGRAEIDRALVEPGHQLHRHRRQPGLGIAVGGGVIAIDVAEIALAVDQRVAEREILGEADHRIVDRLVAMGVVFADHVADDARRFLVGPGGVEPKQPHAP